MNPRAERGAGSEPMGKRGVRAFFEISRDRGLEPAIVHRDQVLADPQMLATVESELRGKLLDIVEGIEGLNLHRVDPWWMVVREAARERRRTPARE